MSSLLEEQLAKNKNSKYFIFGDKADLKLPPWQLVLDPNSRLKHGITGQRGYAGAEFYSKRCGSCRKTAPSPERSPAF
jgi:hypothetical protein